MPAVVNSVAPDSIAEDLELETGDEIVSVNGAKLLDLVDYRYYMMSEEVSLHVKRIDGTEEIIDIEKDIDEDLGIVFESAVFDKVLPCTNKCIFCFVDQQPCKLRESMYVKDDDYRLSYLQGTYVTLTNMSKSDKKRIEMMRLGPLYVSVHTTNPDLRVKMLKNPKSGNIIKELKWLESMDIPVHAQIVLCPGFNDGDELTRTLDDLSSLENIASIAVVPVGITKFRKDSELKLVTPKKAEEVIEQVNAVNAQIGYNLAAASDEFFILSNKSFPTADYYNGYGQLDDGVGSARLLFDDFDSRKSKLPSSIAEKKVITIATGSLACRILEPIIAQLNKIKNLTVNLLEVKSEFWGENVTVAGLITGADLVNALLSQKNNLGAVFIPSIMMRKLTDEFIDGYKLSDVQSKVGHDVFVIDDCYSTLELENYILL